jgi:hypothetical protein
MGRVDQYDRYRVDRRALATIGRALSGAPVHPYAVVPEHLAAAAVVAWERDELDPVPSPETQEQADLRHGAAALALIGLAIQQHGSVRDGQAVVPLDADLVAQSMAAAEISD